MKIIHSLLLALVLTGCATIVHPVDNTKNIRTVAVIVAAQDMLTLTYVGWLQVKHEDVSVDWGIPQRLTDRMKSELGSSYEVKSLRESPDAALLAATKDLRGDGFADAGSHMIDFVKTSVGKGQVDAIVAVAETSGASYKYAAGGGPDYPFYIAYMYRVMVFDGHTLEPIASEFGSIYRKRPLGINEYDNPAVDVDLRWRGEPYASMSETTREHIRAGVYYLIDQSVPFTLRNQLHLLH